MNDEQWRIFFLAAAETLGSGSHYSPVSASWSAWTTFTRLAVDCGYWTSGLPRIDDIADTHIRDGGVWGQPFPFAELAHLIVPRRFSWFTDTSEPYRSGSRLQDVNALSDRLTKLGVEHRTTELVLEIKLY